MQILRDKDLKGLMSADYRGDISRVTLADEDQCCGIMAKLSVDSQWKVTVDTSGGQHEVKEHYKPGRQRVTPRDTGERTSTFSSGSIYEIVQDTEDGLHSTLAAPSSSVAALSFAGQVTTQRPLYV